MVQLSPELRFISKILRLSLRANHCHSEVRSLRLWDHINWDRLVPLATYHGVVGLLFYCLRELGLEKTLPGGVLRGLNDIYKSVSDDWEYYQKVIKEILRRFHENEVDVILLKGAQLAYTDYPHSSLRPMGDIDLLVNRSDQLRVIKLMLEMGFNLYETCEILDKFFIKGMSRRGTEETHKPVFIEVHSTLEVPIRLRRYFSMDMDEFWDCAQMKYIDGIPFLQLCPTHNLMYLCTHFGEHYFSRLIWAYDITLLIHRHREEIDWEKLEHLCVRMKIRNPLYYSLSLCQKFFEISMPERVLKNLSPSWWRSKISHFHIRKNLLLCGQSRISRLLIKVLCIDSWLEALLWFLFPTREWIKQHYSVQGTYGIYPYYLFHPILYLIKSVGGR